MHCFFRAERGDYIPAWTIKPKGGVAGSLVGISPDAKSFLLRGTIPCLSPLHMLSVSPFIERCFLAKCEDGGHL